MGGDGTLGGTETRGLGLAGPSLLTSELPGCHLGFLSLARRSGISTGFSMGQIQWPLGGSDPGWCSGNVPNVGAALGPAQGMGRSGPPGGLALPC